MAMTYTTLTAAKTTAGSIKSWVNYARLDVEQIVEEMQTLIYQNMRVREMRSLWSPSVSIGDSTKALVAGFLDPNGKLRDTDNNVYRYVATPDRLEEMRIFESGALSSRQPYNWTIFDEALQFDAKFDEARTLRLPVHKSPALLAASSNETNFLTTRYPHIVRMACVVRAHAFMKNWSSHNAELPVLMSMIQDANAKDDLVLHGADFDTEA